MRKYFFILFLTLLLSSCSNKKHMVEESKIVKEEALFEDREEVTIINPEGRTIEERYLPIEGFKRSEVAKNDFGNFLRKVKLKPHGSKVLYFDGREKTKDVYDSVFDIDIGDRDLHQCADAIMLLRGEYLYELGEYDNISFNFVSGFKAEYSKWMEGYRIKVDGNNASYYKDKEPSNTYEDFRKYMDMVFAYSSTLSLDKELETIDIYGMEIGDVFIVGGSPGHAVLVVDMAENELGEKIFILAQSYMPAQETQILLNKNNDLISPWYSLKDGDKLDTPEWTFEWTDIKRFPSLDN